MCLYKNETDVANYCTFKLKEANVYFPTFLLILSCASQNSVSHQELLPCVIFTSSAKKDRLVRLILGLIRDM